VGVLGVAAVAEADSNFSVFCGFSHANHDDPIVYPGQVGKAHLHHFFGSRDTDAYSTVSSMRNAGTTCGFNPDTAGYWVPALKDRTGKVIQAYRISTYYWGDKQTKPFPEGLKILAGGDTRKLKQAGWSCGDGFPQSSLPQDCGGREVRAVIVFPSCWDGERKDSADHRSHMAYPEAGGCPTRAYPVKVPKLVYHVRYPVYNASGYTLSSGSAYTLHGDFWNTWTQSVLAQKVSSCLNQLKICKLR
jgi:hypothetical protein